MQQRDDRRLASGRPSLLSTEQQAEADRNRILSKLDGKPEAKVASHGKAAWLAVGAAVVSLCAGAALWGAYDTPADVAQAGAAPTEPVQAPVVTAAPAAAPAEPEVSAAAILDEVAGAAGTESLQDMLDAPAPAKPAEQDELTQLLAAAPAAAVHAPATKTPPKPRAEKVAHKPAPRKKNAAAPAKPVRQADSDVALLAALVAHSKAPQARTLKQCKQLGGAEAEQCRARLCASSAKNEADCKRPRVVKAASTS